MSWGHKRFFVIFQESPACSVRGIVVHDGITVKRNLARSEGRDGSHRHTASEKD